MLNMQFIESFVYMKTWGQFLQISGSYDFSKYFLKKTDFNTLDEIKAYTIPLFME